MPPDSISFEDWLQELKDLNQKGKQMLECENHCPKCHSEDIDWSTKDIQDSVVYQNAICNVCNCEFTEIWKYHHTEIDEPIYDIYMIYED